MRSPSIDPAKIEPLSVESMLLGPLPADPSGADSPAAPTPPQPPRPPARVSAPDQQVAAEPVVDDPEMSGQIVPALRVAAPTPIIPALGTIEPGPADASGGNEAAGVSTDVLPEIQEATPAPGMPAIVHASVSAGTDPAAVESPMDYQLPTVPQPDQSQLRAAPTQSPLAVSFAQPSQPLGRNRSGRGIMLLFTLVVLAGLVAAGIVFGRPYLFPEEGEALQGGADTGAELVVTAETTGAYTERLTNELTGDWTTQQAQWRALGLLNGAVDDEVVSDLLSGWQDAVYSTQDGGVYYDQNEVGDSLDSEVALASAYATLDQQFSWSAGQESRTLDGAALTLAEVHGQSTAIQQASEFSGEIEASAAAPLVFLPPVLGYEVLAPSTFAEFVFVESGQPNPLSVLDQGGPGPMASEVLIDAAAPIVVDGDQVVGSPAAMDSSFWYLVFAGYVDNTTAKAASDAIVENSLVTADRNGTKCVYSTFSGGDVNQTATLRATIEAWSANVPAEFGSSTSVLPDGTLQFVSCDPGSGFENQSRLGTARELVGWRIAELATLEAVVGSGGSEADAAAALAQVDASSVGAELAILPLDTSPAEAAEAARSAVAVVLGLSAG